MLHDYRQMLPSWIEEDLSDHVMCLSDDIDSLVSCALLNRAKGMTINYFFDFRNLHVFNKEDSRQAIGVDIALTTGRCFDNHVTLVTEDGHLNPKSVNLNSMLRINSSNYTQKYAGSTALTVYSLNQKTDKRNVLCDLTEEGRMLLLAIDSGYLGHYKPEFKDTHKRYMTILDLPEMSATLERHSREEFEALKEKYNLNAKIKLGPDDKLTTDIDLEGVGRALGLNLALPTESATLLRSGKLFCIDTTKIESTEGLSKKRVVSLAITHQNTAKYTRFAG